MNDCTRIMNFQVEKYMRIKNKNICYNCYLFDVERSGKSLARKQQSSSGK